MDVRRRYLDGFPLKIAHVLMPQQVGDARTKDLQARTDRPETAVYVSAGGLRRCHDEHGVPKSRDPLTILDIEPSALATTQMCRSFERFLHGRDLLFEHENSHSANTWK